MKRFENLPIRRKLLVMALLICGAVLLVAIPAFFTFQVLNFRSNFERDTATLAAIIANQSTAAVTFNDEVAVREMLRSLQEKSNVVSASLIWPKDESPPDFLPQGILQRKDVPNISLAQYGQNEHLETLERFPLPGNFRYSAGHLLFTQSVELKNHRIAMLYLQMDYESTYQALIGLYERIIACVLVVSLSLAIFLSGLLGRIITRPVLQLARTAKIVGEKKDYSVRAVVSSHGDEVGRLAESFNEMLGRIETQDAALSLSQQKMEALIHSIDGIVWERAPDTFRFTFISRQSETILGFAPQAWLDRPGFWESKLHPHDAAKAIQTGHEMAARGEPYSFEYRLIAATGRTVWIRESGMVLVEKGRPVAMRGIFQNITQNKLDAEQLDKLNRQLVDTSRSAGMADVATGVLHNVGNVLNSVSVSATLVGERLRRSKVVNLRRATAMMRGQNSHLAEYLTTDAKGRLLPEYLGTVAEQLATEQADLIAEMDSVGLHIEHIKEIVAMQQSYAKVSGAYENLPPVELVEDALRLNLTAFERHHINLVREFDPNLPKVCVDRHKFLQILINLLRNAKHAMEDERGHERRMVIRVTQDSQDAIKVIVSDNGMGIPPENLNRIFNHGFTTKKDGHGFGLHSGANAAKEMGGQLSGHSDGPGKGAVFTLVLPTADAKHRTDHIEPPT